MDSDESIERILRSRNRNESWGTAIGLALAFVVLILLPVLRFFGVL